MACYPVNTFLLKNFFIYWKKTFPHNWISILDVEMAFLTLKRKLKLKIKFKKLLPWSQPKSFLFETNTMRKINIFQSFFSLCKRQFWLLSIQSRGVGIRTHNYSIVNPLWPWLKIVLNFLKFCFDIQKPDAIIVVMLFEVTLHWNLEWKSKYQLTSLTSLLNWGYTCP
jgi:hypothetical protein